MKRQDIYVLAAVLLVVAVFSLFDSVYAFYGQFNQEHGFIMSFIKFAVLATFGESLGLRICKGVYNYSGFGLLPRAIVWGFLGIVIKMAFVIFATGVPPLLQYAGMQNVSDILRGGFSISQVFVAFSISVFANTFFAPVMMVFHKVTDTHIVNNGGTVKGLLSRIDVGGIMAGINWQMQWDFVFKKTIPIFWIPAHTITFLLPADLRVLFAALLGVALGVILAIAALKSQPEAAKAD